MVGSTVAGLIIYIDSIFDPAVEEIKLFSNCGSYVWLFCTFNSNRYWRFFEP